MLRDGSRKCQDGDKRAVMDTFLRTRGILYWKRERGAPAGEGIGRAWVVEADGRERLINGGDPISRTEAERLAEVGNHTLDAEP